MRGWGGLFVVVVIGCHGETVEPARHDAAIADTPASDTSATDTPVSGDCGAYRGSKMIKVHDAYCIDEHEVTNGQWREFAADSNAWKSAPEHCAWNVEPPAIDPDPGTDAYPRTKVNLCDAKTYCAWAGKRLCGTIGGGALFLSQFADASKSQWFHACTGGATRKYPYGDTYDEAKCATGSFAPAQPKEFANCHGVAAPFTAVFDLSGNVDEWEDACATSFATATTLCRGRGGATGDHADATCDRSSQSEAKSRFDGLGFRCCKDL